MTKFDFGNGPVPAHRHKNPDGTEGGWVADTALVCGNAQVYGDAQVSGNAQVYGNALVRGDAQVYGNALVCGDALVCGNAQVSGNALVSGNAQVYGNARVSGNVQVYGDALVCGDVQVYGDARVSGNAQVSGDALVSGKAAVACGFIRYGWTAHREKNNTAILVYGCERHTVEEWKRNLTTIIARHVADKAERKQYAAIIKSLLALAATLPKVTALEGDGT